MLKRNDGTVCFLHRNYSDGKVHLYEGIQEGNLDVPPTGLGGSDGNRGYFQARINKGVRYPHVEIRQVENAARG